jgi:PqqD family protein of HPr-rel-A system
LQFARFVFPNPSNGTDVAKTPRPDLTTCTVDGEVVILDRAAGLVHHLNATASQIWRSCEDARSVNDIAARVAACFEGEPDVVRQDVMRTLADLERLGLLVDRPVNASAAAKGDDDESR